MSEVENLLFEKNRVLCAKLDTLEKQLTCQEKFAKTKLRYERLAAKACLDAEKARLEAEVENLKAEVSKRDTLLSLVMDECIAVKAAAARKPDTAKLEEELKTLKASHSVLQDLYSVSESWSDETQVQLSHFSQLSQKRKRTSPPAKDINTSMNLRDCRPSTAELRANLASIAPSTSFLARREATLGESQVEKPADPRPETPAASSWGFDIPTSSGFNHQTAGNQTTSRLQSSPISFSRASSPARRGSKGLPYPMTGSEKLTAIKDCPKLLGGSRTRSPEEPATKERALKRKHMEDESLYGSE